MSAVIEEIHRIWHQADFASEVPADTEQLQKAHPAHSSTLAIRLWQALVVSKDGLVATSFWKENVVAEK